MHPLKFYKKVLLNHQLLLNQFLPNLCVTLLPLDAARLPQSSEPVQSTDSVASLQPSQSVPLRSDGFQPHGIHEDPQSRKLTCLYESHS